MKYVKWGIVILYMYFILTKTIIGRQTQVESIFRGLFWEVQNGYWRDIWLNILLFIPLGFLIGGWNGVVVGFVFSCGIEATQYIFRLGFCEVDDVVNNTIGAGIGVGMNAILKACRRDRPKIEEESG